MTDADRFHIPPTASPSVNAAYVLDLKPLISWVRDMVDRERTAAADAKCEARGHREEVVKLEAMLRSAVAERAAALEALEHARCDAKDAQQMLMDERKRVQAPREELTPGSVDAIKAAVRLVCGHEPSVQPTRNDCQAYWCTPCETELPEQFKARLGLLALLETLQPAATVKP